MGNAGSATMSVRRGIMTRLEPNAAESMLLFIYSGRSARVVLEEPAEEAVAGDATQIPCILSEWFYRYSGRCRWNRAIAASQKFRVVPRCLHDLVLKSNCVRRSPTDKLVFEQFSVLLRRSPS